MLASIVQSARVARTFEGPPEIHDVLAHALSALAVQLEGTRVLVEQRSGDPAAVAAVERSHRIASEGLAEACCAVGALRGVSMSGRVGLSRLVDDFTEASATPGHFEVSGDPISLSSKAQVALYRAAHEALGNVRQHTHATSVDGSPRYDSEGSELLVVDHDPSVITSRGPRP